MTPCWIRMKEEDGTLTIIGRAVQTKSGWTLLIVATWQHNGNAPAWLAVPAIDYLAEHMPEITRVVVYMKGRGQVYSLPMASVLAWRAQRKYLRKPERGCQRLSPPLREWQLTRVSEPFLLPHVSLAQEQWIVVRPAEVATV